ncbi:porin [Pelagibaculum spongiae]|uniref:Porin domain-containing protein n=1 Tax=Pelagibaculum spongiae TaxID=2080658 RepID=A0A2V1H516_9GAMM|nr:porin [Pelagibaculum spongiae]PVZ72328.1 hypothetical protein DC094_04795 [Pelagibaculum spongiae]
MIKLLIYRVVIAIFLMQPVVSFASQSLEEKIRQLEEKIGQLESLTGQGKGATVELYGSVRTLFEAASIEQGTSDLTTTDFQNAESRLGLRIAAKPASDWSVQFRGEWNLDGSDEGNFGSGRLSYIELENKDWGRFAFGRQWTGFYQVIGAPLDTANNGSLGGFDAIGAPDRLGNLLTYNRTVDLLGKPLSIQVDGEFSGEDGAKDTLESYAFSSSLDLSEYLFGLSYGKYYEDGEAANLLGLSAGYQNRKIFVSTSYILKSVGEFKPSAFDLSVLYSKGKDKLLGKVYLYNSYQKGSASQDALGFLLSLQHQLNDQLRLWGEVGYTDSEGDALSDDDRTKYYASLGVRFDFSVGLN